MLYRLGVLECDGIGPEIVPAARQVVDAAVAAEGIAPVSWVELDVGAKAIEATGTALPLDVLESLGELDGWLLGPHDSESYPQAQRQELNPSGRLRKHYDLFANIRPARAYPGSNAIVEGTDLVIVRQNTEGFYGDRNMVAGTGEFMPSPDLAIAMGVVTRRATERIAHEAFRLAMRRRRHLTIVHKANVLRLTMGMFRSVIEQIGREFYPEVLVDDFHVDAIAARLVRRADAFDVIVTENMMGDILSDLTGELAGSLGIAASLNASEQHAMAQAAHGSAPDIAGRDLANPVAMMLSAAMLLRWLGTRHDDSAAGAAAARIEVSIDATIAAGIRTRDLGGTAGTSAFTRAVLDRLA